MSGASYVRRALKHLPEPSGIGHSASQGMTIDVWDVAETRISSGTAGAKPGDPPTVMKSTEDGRYIGEDRHHGTLWLDRKARHIVGCIEGVNRLTLDARARPFHKLLSAWLFDRDVQFVHAGLISAHDKAILLVGHGGAGKSTASVSCLQAGMGYLGDDFVGIEKNGNGFTGHGFYASCLLDQNHIKRFPNIASGSLPPNLPNEYKHVVFLGDNFGHVLQNECKISAVAMPRIVDTAASSFEPATPIQAMRGIAPTSVMYLPRPSKRAFETLFELVSSVPCYWFNSGSDIDGIGKKVKTFVGNL